MNQFFLSLAAASVFLAAWNFIQLVVRLRNRRRDAASGTPRPSICLSDPIAGLLLLGAVLPAVFLWIGSLVHISEQERDYYHRTHVKAVAARFEQDATACAAHANRWAEVGQQTLDTKETTDVVQVEVNVRHVNRQYAGNVRCLLQATQRIVPQRSAHEAHRVAIVVKDGQNPFGIDNGDGVHMSCRTPATSAQATKVRALLAVEVSRWKNNETVVADSRSADVFEVFAYLTSYLTSPERFPLDLGDRSPLFSSDGASAWVSYDPAYGRFTVNPPTVDQLVNYCQTLAETA